MKMGIKRWSGLVLALGLGLLLSGCSKAGSAGNARTAAFASATPELKKLWTDGLTAWQGHHFAEAANSLVVLHGKSAELPPPQAEALASAIDQLGTEAFIAADKGDAGAVEAVKALRSITGRRANVAPAAPGVP